MSYVPSSNGSVFIKDELRNGPPLDYVGEKLRKAVEAAHETCRMVRAYVPSNLPSEPEMYEHVPAGTKNELLENSSLQAFDYALFAFLLLYNMAGSYNHDDTAEKLLKKDWKTFSKWLDAVERGGSVLGLS